MSLIVATTWANGTAALGTDTGTWSGSHYMAVPLPKCFRLGRALVGLAGPASFGQRVRRRLPAPDLAETAEDWLFDSMMPAYRQAGDSVATAGGEPSWAGSSGVVVLDGYIFDIHDGDAAVVRAPANSGTYCRGASEDFARGAAVALKFVQIAGSAEGMVRLVLDMTSRVADTCRAPFDVLTAGPVAPRP